MKKTIFLHIGTYKTGSTSIQSFLHKKKLDLNRLGFRVYESIYGQPNHIDLYLSTMRYERDSFRKLGSSETFDAAYTDRVCANMMQVLSETNQENLIASTEGLSLLRFSDEISRLCRLLKDDENRIEVIVYLRKKASFLRSYEAQIRKRKGRVPSSNKASALYVGDDSWLIDYDALLRAYRDGLNCRITAIQYEQELATHGSVLPSFINWMGLSVSDFPDWNDFQLNKTAAPRARPRA